jgi:4-amino-4-deoxy-L-arabinose transferase-like glycosyltransferase
MDNLTAKKKTKILFWIILAAAFLVRVIRFGTLPAGVNQDEAMGAVDAWALSLYGTDRFGVRFPVHFSAWQVSQMSVLLSYLMVPFIKIFGFHTWVIRLPMLLVSVLSIAIVYLIGKRLLDERFALIAMALTAINPWHYMQSRWSIDCNLFPHIFLIGFYLLLLGLEKKRYLYLSMVFFGLTFYCYGIAVYSVTPFLAVFALWGLRKKLFSWKEAGLSVLIFGVVALPEILVMAINLFRLDTIETGFITMSRFPESVRGNDILFLNFSFAQLGKNIWALIKTSFLQLPDYWFNAIPAFGPMYHISIPFMLGGGVLLTGALFREKNALEQAKKLALWGFLLTGIWVGIITYEVNVNRINIIFYPLIFVSAYCIYRLSQKSRRWLAAAGVAYALCGVLFLGSYFTVYPKEAAQYYNGEFLEAVKCADSMEYADHLYITGNMGWQFNTAMAEILTQYACGIDAAYYQEKSMVTGGRELLPYSERYHFINPESCDWEECDAEGLYLLHEKDLENTAEKFEVLQEIGQFRLAVRVK